MNITHWISRFSQSAFGLPLILPLLLMPLSTQLSIRLVVEGGYVYLIYLPLAMYLAMLLVFDWRAMPGIALVLSLYYFSRFSPLPAALIISVTLAVLALGMKGYKLHAGRRGKADYGGLSLAQVRLLWLAFLMPTLFVFGMQGVATTGVVALDGTVFTPGLFTLHTLLNYQSVLLSCVTMVQIYYFAIRCIRKPRFIRVIYCRLTHQRAANLHPYECVAWLSLVAFLLVMLLLMQQSEDNLLASDYGLPLLLPLMLWSAMRFGYLFTSLSWAVLLVVLYQLRDRFLCPETEPYHLAVMSANLLVFSLTILMMAAISTRQRRILIKTRLAALSDPVFNLPNLRALSADLNEIPLTLLFYLSIPELDRLSRMYGLRLRIQYKRSLANYLLNDLQPGEDVYQLPGFDLAIRLNYTARQQRIESIEASLKAFHLRWEGLPIHPDIGISYCTVRRPVTHLYELLGEMSAMAEQSLRTGIAESLLRNNSLPVQRRIAEKVAVMDEIRDRLRNQGYPILAQRVQGVRGDDYYDLTLSMQDSSGQTLSPEKLDELGLSWEVDRWTLEHVLAFADRQRDRLAVSRFAVTLFISSLCRPTLAKEIKGYLELYDLQPWQLIIQVADSPLMNQARWGGRSALQLLQLGCRVVVTDFGSEFAGYARLKELEGDMLKVDARFISSMLQDCLNYQVIAAICALAQSKRMGVIACGVNSLETEQALRQLGVDYFQGEAIGAARPLQEMIQAGVEK
ncbi:diguanylate cyclase/phosphodiesterase [Erwinia billingiae Eb661]|uniref:Diguanylate cyclase/phosphodiesterase n=1 Tax=Erwinia billingiae (strain Eb661) TaxID=634500 RepID=D8MVN6_ERWBE|nr:EAL domain-containing protein [Erwinia billingiae]CAX60893.1 diguanylate cyclase/phosphodiesterase [Erwinia billingiae Eb661]